MLGTLLMLVFGVTWSWAVDYELLIEDPDIFSICTEGPPGSITVPEALNFDDLSINMDSDTIHVAGNATVRWEVEPTDRIVVKSLPCSERTYQLSPNACILAGKDGPIPLQSWHLGAHSLRHEHTGFLRRHV